jgi:hypothetical protein
MYPIQAAVSTLDDPTVDALPDVDVVEAGLIPADQGDSGSSKPVSPLAAIEGLTPDQRASAQHVVAQGARLLLDHANAVHYTEGRARWEGIANRLFVRDGRFPTHGDCSSTATWLLWNALFAHLGMSDVVNGEGWRSGFTGTMLQHGKAVSSNAAQVGDLAIYGNGGTGQHVAVSLGGGMVFSHGSEDGPFKIRLGYRSDLMCVRRYF